MDREKITEAFEGASCRFSKCPYDGKCVRPYRGILVRCKRMVVKNVVAHEQ